MTNPKKLKHLPSYLRKRFTPLAHRVGREVTILFRRLGSRWRKLPDFIIIGVQKAGTSSLFHYLSQHPELSLSIEKEVHFFDNNFRKGLSWYKSFFPFRSDKSKTGEASPYYVFHPLAPYRIKSLLPEVKLIVLLRNPIERSLSHYQHNKRKKEREPANSFEDALQKEKERIQGEKERLENEPDYISFAYQHFSYLSRSDYAPQVEHWLQHFRREQILFLKTESFFAEPESVLEKVYQFLEIKTVFPKDLSPRNQGNYQRLTSKNREAFVGYFKGLQKKRLIELLGEEFSWE
jgi:hypothetical protein